jgi:thioredoxin 1
MSAITITSENFEQEVMKSEKPVLLDFWAPWCGPCQMIGPFIEEIANEVDYVKVGKINIDDEFDLATTFGAMSIPLLAVVKDGEVVNQNLGAVPKETILELIAEYKN